MELRKNILAKDFAITHWIPNALMISGACSLEEPQPKFFPATMMSPGLIWAASSGRSGENPYCFISSMVFNARYSVGMMISVSMSSPSTQTLPVNFSIIYVPSLNMYSLFVLCLYVSQISDGSAIFPAIADAVTVAADPRYTLELGCPARPLKLRVPVLIRTSFSPITP